MRDELIEAVYPATPTQSGMLFHSLYEPESDVYQLQIAYRIEGALDETLFARCWNRALERHAILRTAFLMDAPDRPLQAVWRKASVPLESHDLSTLPAGERRQRIDAHLEAGRRPFPLGEPPLLRLLLLRETPNSFLFVWTVHHALLDGWSKSIVISELFADYERESSGAGLQVTAESAPFRDYVEWLDEQNGNEAEAREFWRGLLRGFLQPTPLPIAPRAPKGPGPRRADRWNESALERRLSRDLTDRIRDFARSERTTVNVILQAAWSAVLSRYSGEEDVVFGATISTRPPSLAGAETIVGPLLNTVPVRAEIGPLDSTRDLLHLLRSQQGARSRHEMAPLSDIQSWSEVSRRAPLFESVFVFENFPEDAYRSPDGRLDVRREFTIQRTNYALEFVVFPDPRLLLLIGFDPHRFGAPEVESLLARIEILIGGMVESPDVPIANLPLAAAEELSALFQEAGPEPPAAPTVVQMFEARALRDPNALAVASVARPRRGRRGNRGPRWTYGELNARSNRLAHHLLRRGVGPESVVGVSVSRSFQMVSAVLGILKAGGAYLPLDPAYPAGRLRYMVEDAGAQWIVVDGQTKSAFPALADRAIVLDEDPALAGASGENPASVASPRDLAYVIYTSGSTGAPKGVEIEHRSLSNYIAAAADRLELSPSDRVLQFASLGFDVAAEEIFATLSRGATLVLRSDEMVGTIDGFLESCRESKITVLDLPTSYWHELVAEAGSFVRDLPEALRLVVIGGESALPDRVARFLDLSGGRVRLLNAYGPTEATVTATFWEAPRGGFTAGRVPIGRPIPNVRVHALDSSLRPVPHGVVGELCVGGVGVGRGYRNRPDLTAERFVPDPFSGRGNLYRTGDRGRVGPGGDLEYLGRLDNQVKVRGFRVEVEEIEAALRRVSGVREAVVQAREDVPGRKRLAAYIVPGSEGPPARSALRAGLGATLPDHMVPYDFVFLDALPMTPNGKIDRRNLPAPEEMRSELEDDFVAPRTELETRIARIWSEVLCVDRVGVHDNFFDLGGHSLLAMRLLARVEREVGAGLSLAGIFRSPTVAAMAAVFDGSSPRTRSPSLVAVQPKGIHPPFFCVHAETGIVYYRQLARLLGADQPFYGIQSQGLDGRARPLETVEEMATCYLREIRAFQPEGPYYLGGHSFGGKVAFEMARQLAAAGQRTALLALFDTARPASPASSGRERLDRVRGRTRMHVERLSRMSPRERMSYLMGRWETARSVLARAVGRVAESVRHPLRRAQRRVRAANIRAASRYVPGHYEGRVTIFRATDRGSVKLLDPHLGWGELCAGGVEVYEVPGEHSSILLEDSNLRMLGAKLRECLRRVRETERHSPPAMPRDVLSR